NALMRIGRVHPQALVYPLTVSASNASGTPTQSFTLTVAKADQTISFNGPASQPFTSSTINLTASSSSGLLVTLASNSTSVCTVVGTTLTLVGVGTCGITASQTGDANFNAATSLTRGFTVSQATQSISFPPQVPASRSFVAASIFAISPIATATSGLPVIYTSTTPAVCSVVGLNATMLAPGTCTIAANQSGSANFQSATQATQNVSLSTTVSGVPVIGAATGGNGQATINFTAPASNGGSAITSYTATCNPGNFSAVGSASPLVVSGLANNVVHTCSVTATNGVGTSAPSAGVVVTPLSGQGSSLWTQVCDVCHTAVPSGTQLNGAGTSATALNYVRANQTLMAFNAGVQALSNADLIDIANYIASVIPGNDVSTSVDVPMTIDVNNHITLTGQPWSAFTAVEVVSGPAHGTLSAFTDTSALYTPAAGYIGPDSFTYRGKRTGGIAYNGDPQTVTIMVNPLAPVITSATSANGVFGLAFSYLTIAENSPTSYDITGLPAGLTASAAGLISGVPAATGQFSVSISATNAGGT
ncbi:MAG: Ig-like domain-containing protein, partial [Usitatibacteraceae bacterium]